MATARLLPLTVLCLFLLLAASAGVPAATATAAGGDYYGGGARMVVITRGTGARVIAGAARGDRSHNKWPHNRALVEDEVAPELDGGMLGVSSNIGYGALHPDTPACPHDNPNQCAAKGEPYTRPCAYIDRCRH